MPVISTELLGAIRQQYRLPWDGIHGVSHWVRVRETGLQLAAQTGASAVVVELFAAFHDACRFNEGLDREHGRRGAALAARLRGTLFTLGEDDFAQLQEACIFHTDGLLEAEVTIQTCWDADRLDLPRTGVAVDPACLCTAAARDPAMLAWAGRRSTTIGPAGEGPAPF
jgi:uncharacterized protein